MASGRHVIVVGDLNVSHTTADIHSCFGLHKVYAPGMAAPPLSLHLFEPSNKFRISPLWAPQRSAFISGRISLDKYSSYRFSGFTDVWLLPFRISTSFYEPACFYHALKF